MMLSPKKRRFCEEFVIDLNATKAAVRAGYSRATARTIGSKLLTKVDIQECISQLQGEMAERNKLKADDVINELRKLAFWNIKDFIKSGNVIRDLSRMQNDMTKPVAGIKVKETSITLGPTTTKEVTTEIKLSDKRAALVDLGRHLGIFDKDNKQKSIKIKITRK